MVTEVDFDKLLEYCDDLITYEGKLPLLVRAVIMKEYSENLNKKGLYDKVMRECVETKPHTYDGAVGELMRWCTENQKYKDMIK